MNLPFQGSTEADQQRFEELIPYMPFTYVDLLKVCRALDKEDRTKKLLGEIRNSHVCCAMLTSRQGTVGNEVIVRLLFVGEAPCIVHGSSITDAGVG